MWGCCRREGHLDKRRDRDLSSLRGALTTLLLCRPKVLPGVVAAVSSDGERPSDSYRPLQCIRRQNSHISRKMDAGRFLFQWHVFALSFWACGCKEAKVAAFCKLTILKKLSRERFASRMPT